MPKLNFNHLSTHERNKKKYDANETLKDLPVKYEVSPVMISRWKKGFMYLTAIIDVYSRFNVGLGGSGSKGFEKQN